jgi:hypothetical protein
MQVAKHAKYQRLLVRAACKHHCNGCECHWTATACSRQHCVTRVPGCSLCCVLSGVVPACASLDCLTVFSRSVGDGAAIMAVMERGAAGPADVWRRSSPLPLTYSPGAPLQFTFGVPGPEFLDWRGPGAQAVRSREVGVHTRTAMAASLGCCCYLQAVQAAGHICKEGMVPLVSLHLLM